MACSEGTGRQQGGLETLGEGEGRGEDWGRGATGGPVSPCPSCLCRSANSRHVFRCVYTVRGPTWRPSPGRGPQLGPPPSPSSPSGQRRGWRGERLAGREGCVSRRRGREGGVPAAGAQPRPAGPTSVSRGRRAAAGRGHGGVAKQRRTR